MVAKRILENKGLSLVVIKNGDLLDNLKKRRIEIAKRYDNLILRMDDAKKRSDDLLHRQI